MITTSGTLYGSATANSMSPMIVSSRIAAALRPTNRSPRPWSNTVSTGTRESMQPSTNAYGAWCGATLAPPRRGVVWMDEGSGDEPGVALLQALPRLIGGGQLVLVAGPTRLRRALGLGGGR